MAETSIDDEIARRIEALTDDDLRYIWPNVEDFSAEPRIDRAKRSIRDIVKDKLRVMLLGRPLTSRERRHV